jgi:hypothetical protein
MTSPHARSSQSCVHAHPRPRGAMRTETMLSVPHARAIPGQPYWLPIPSDCARCEHPATPMQRARAIQQVVPAGVRCSGTRLCGRIRARTRSLFLSATRRGTWAPSGDVRSARSMRVCRYSVSVSACHALRWFKQTQLSLFCKVVKSVPFCKDEFERALFTPHM